MKPTRMAIVYSAASIVIGPLMFVLGYGLFTRGGGDYCDAVYFFPDGSVDPIRATEFHNAQLFQVIGASIMIVVGGRILASFATNRGEKRGALAVGTALAVALMMLGYVLVILSSGSSGQVC